MIYGFSNGYFQASFVKLENQKHDLQMEKEKLESDVEQIQEQKAVLEMRKVNLLQRIDEAELLFKDKKEIKEKLEDLRKDIKRTAPLIRGLGKVK